MIYVLLGCLVALALADGVLIWLLMRRLTPAPIVAPPVPADALAARALELVTEAETWDASGEAKRHRVYARLIKDFPTLRRRVLARAIEDALGG